jgi:hypothetical protein
VRPATKLPRHPCASLRVYELIWNSLPPSELTERTGACSRATWRKKAYNVRLVAEGPRLTKPWLLARQDVRIVYCFRPSGAAI